jgi:hypothetical protein
LIERRWYSNILDIRSFRGADCDTGRYLVIAKVLERLAVRKQAALKVDVERCNLRKINELEVRKQYDIESKNRVSTLENLSDDKNINRAWESIKESIKTAAEEGLGLHESKQHKPWFDEECLGILDQRIHDLIQSNVDNLNNVRHNASRHSRNKKKALQ